MDAFAALADPVRRSLLDEMAAGPARVVDLAAGRPISRPAVSKHLKVLADARLVDVRPVGTRRLYRWRPDGLRDVAAFVDDMWTDSLARLKAAAEREAWPARTRAAKRKEKP